MEVRKLDSGMRAWAAKPGEHYLQTTGEKSGLWRNRGRAPQKLTGVGFIAEGFETSAPYRKMPDAWHRTVSWITEGIEGEVFGDKGLAYDAAAGVELDRYDLSLGTPPHTKIIASSGGHSDNYVLVTEELLYAYAGLTGSLDYRIRADMTYFTAPNDGAVFSTGIDCLRSGASGEWLRQFRRALLANVVNAFLEARQPPWQQLDDRGKAVAIVTEILLTAQRRVAISLSRRRVQGIAIRCVSPLIVTKRSPHRLLGMSKARSDFRKTRSTALTIGHRYRTAAGIIDLTSIASKEAARITLESWRKEQCALVV